MIGPFTSTVNLYRQTEKYVSPASPRKVRAPSFPFVWETVGAMVLRLRITQPAGQHLCEPRASGRGPCSPQSSISRFQPAALYREGVGPRPLLPQCRTPLVSETPQSRLSGRQTKALTSVAGELRRSPCPQPAKKSRQNVLSPPSCF